MGFLLRYLLILLLGMLILRALGKALIGLIAGRVARPATAERAAGARRPDGPRPGVRHVPSP